MSSKTKTQKPATTKTEAENGEEVLVAQDTTEEAVSGEDQQDGAIQKPDISDQAGQPEADASEVPATIVTVAEESAGEDQPVNVNGDGLATRLTKAVNAIQTSGKPDMVHALHKAELILGSLKTALPAAIETIEGLSDESLKADLQTLLALL